MVALGAGAALLGVWVFRQPEPRPVLPLSHDLEIIQAINRVRGKVDDLEKLVEQQGRPHGEPSAGQSPVEKRAPAEVLARLEAIEASLTKLAERKDGPADREHGAPPQQKAKDQALVVQVASKGTKDPGANTREYWGWSPREVQQAFGKPDSTKWSSDPGYQDWFYFSPDGNLALHVRFEAGIVIGVWP